MPSLVEIVRRFRDLRVVVIGDAMLDTYRIGSASRLCTEGPVPVVVESETWQTPGGAANAAANLRALGAEVRVVGIVGPDHSGTILRASLADHGVSDRWLVEDSSVTTMCKERLIADGQYVVRMDTGSTRACSPAGIQQLVSNLRAAFDTCDAVVISDYGYGATPDAVLAVLRELRAVRNVPLVVDSKYLWRFSAMQATVVTPNHHEARALVAASVAGADMDLPVVGTALLKRVDCEHAAITLAADGVLIASRSGTTVHIPAHPIANPADVGAGDSFTSALALGLAAGAEVADAARIAIDAAAIAVMKPRTAIVDQQELLQRVSLRGLHGLHGRHDPTSSSQGEASLLAEKLLVDRLAGRMIVFTNGIFDILHAGHIAFLREARAMGDVLVVGVNSDMSLGRMPAQRRPINSERDRRALIAALDPVDHALLFDESNPSALIRLLHPHIHVKGGDYAAEALPEAEAVHEVGGRIVILPLAGEDTTRAMIDRILSIAVASGGELGSIHD